MSELLACLHALAEPEHHPESRAWLASVRERIPDSLVQRLNQYAPLWARYRCRLLFPLRGPLDRDLPAELHTLAAYDQPMFVSLAASGIRGTSFEGIDDLHDAARQQAFIKASERRSFSRGELARALIDDLVHGASERLAGYSAHCLTYIRRAQEFSRWMIHLLHGPSGADGESPDHSALQRARLESLRTSRSRQDWFADHYVGI